MKTILFTPTFQQAVFTYFFKLFQKSQSFAHQSFTPQLRRPKLPKNYFTIAVILVLLIVSYYLGGKLNKTQSTLAQPTTNSTEIKKQKILNKEFLFPLKNSKGEEIAKLSYKIVSAEIQNSFISKGRPWKAVAGRQFLMLTLKITNPYTQGVQVNSRDYVRLVVNGQPQPDAPDFHNDPLEVQALSTESTRIGFAVANNENKFVIKVGEIKGKKETITLDF